jgi:uncharacterized membrane protein YraQ (UPF0718 family)
MNNKGNRNRMLIPTIIMGVIALILLIKGYRTGEGHHITGVKMSLKLLVEILPLLFFAFIIAGMAQVLVPKELIGKWIGDEAGIKGIVIGSLAGGLVPGGPFVILPLSAGLLRSGAGIGVMISFVTGWSVFSIARLPIEIGFLGWQFTFIRIATTFFFPVIAGLLAHAIFSSSR